MKRLIPFLILFLCGTAYADWCLYRKNGGEVIGVSQNPYDLQNTVFTDQLQCDNGINLVPKKINDNGTIRNAEIAEIEQFVINEEVDDRLAQKANIKNMLKNGDSSGMIFKALALTILDEVNLLRTTAGLQPRTKAQLITAIGNKLDGTDAD